MKTFKKILRYASLAGIVAAIIMIAYGYVRNQSLFALIRTTINSTNGQAAFRMLIIGVLVLILSIVLLCVSFTIGNKKKEEGELSAEEKQ